jgi:hypothetical protein
VCYRNDCKELYGRILGTWNVVSSTQAVCKKQTEEFWNRTYPTEQYELNPSTQLVEGVGEAILGAQKSTEYDLVSAVKRQSSFYYQVIKKEIQRCQIFMFVTSTYDWIVTGNLIFKYFVRVG